MKDGKQLKLIGTIILNHLASYGIYADPFSFNGKVYFTTNTGCIEFRNKISFGVFHIKSFHTKKVPVWLFKPDRHFPYFNEFINGCYRPIVAFYRLIRLLFRWVAFDLPDFGCFLVARSCYAGFRADCCTDPHSLCWYPVRITSLSN